MTEYEASYQEASLVIESKEESIQRTASFQKDMLVREYGELLEIRSRVVDIIS